MTYKQFWEESPYLAIDYRKAYKIQREIANEQAWLCGLYVYDAVAVCLGNALAKKGSKRLDYLERPIDIFPLTKEEKRRREQEERKKVEAAMKALCEAQKRRKGKG